MIVLPIIIIINLNTILLLIFLCLKVGGRQASPRGPQALAKDACLCLQACCGDKPRRGYRQPGMINVAW